MELKNLESFIQVAELGSFTKAAKRLGYTLPNQAAGGGAWGSAV